MACRVEIAARAERDLASLYLYIKAQSSDAAREWYYGLKSAILGLNNLFIRNPLTPEDKRLRHLLYGSKPNVYRVIYQVKKKERKVVVLHIRHGARRRLRRSDRK